MDEEWKQTMEGFGRVWPRVSGQHGPPPPPPKPERGPEPGMPPRPPEDTAALAGFIRMETEAGRRYLTLAERTKGKASSELKRLAAGSRRIVKRLQAEYYLLTGDTCPVPRTEPRIPSVQEGLRQAWLDAREAEKAYLEAAGRTPDDRLSALYGDAAEEKQRQRKTLYALARRMLG